MGIFSWVFTGLVAGFLAKYFVKGEPRLGWIQTILLGIIGGIVGGFIGNVLGLGSVTGFNLGSIILATLGAALSLWVYVRYIK